MRSCGLPVCLPDGVSCEAQPSGRQPCRVSPSLPYSITRERLVLSCTFHARPASVEFHHQSGNHGVHDHPSMHAHGDALLAATMSSREGSSRGGHGGAFRNAVANLRGADGHDQASSRDSSAHGNHAIADALERQASLTATLAAATANSARPRNRRDSALLPQCVSTVVWCSICCWSAMRLLRSCATLTLLSATADEGSVHGWRDGAKNPDPVPLLLPAAVCCASRPLILHTAHHRLPRWCP